MTIVELFFGCPHRRISRVFTIAGRTYQVCYECGAEFDYCLTNMAIAQDSRMPARRPVSISTGKHGAWRNAA